MIGPGEMIGVALQPAGRLEFLQDKPLQAAMEGGGAWAWDAVGERAHVLFPRQALRRIAAPQGLPNF